MEYLLLTIACLTVLNTVMLVKMNNKKQPSTETIALYEEQIKNLKKIGRLNEKYIKLVKDKEDKNNGMVQISEQRRIY